MSFKSDPFARQVQAALEDTDIRDGADLITRDTQRPASVLMPLVKRAEWNVIFTQRPETMPTHAGQISFPGGKIETGEGALEAALRETHEEIGVEASQISLLGRLPSFDAAYQFRITPFVGIVDPNAPLIPEPREVAEIFEVPFSFLMNPDHHFPREIGYADNKFTMYDMPYEEADGRVRNIWGMTAMIIYRLYQRGFETDRKP